MAVDYNRTRKTVDRMIKTYGRLISLVNDGLPENSTDPLGPASQPLVVPNIMGVFVRPSGYIKLGESFSMEFGMWEEADKIVLVLPSLVHNFAKFTKVLDNDGMGYKIYKVEELCPGDVPLLLYLGLRQ